MKARLLLVFTCIGFNFIKLQRKNRKSYNNVCLQVLSYIYFGYGLWHSAEGQRRQNDFHNLANSMQNPIVNPVGSDEKTRLLS